MRQSLRAVLQLRLVLRLVLLGQKVGELDEGVLEALEGSQEERANFVVDLARRVEPRPGLQAALGLLEEISKIVYFGWIVEDRQLSWEGSEFGSFGVCLSRDLDGCRT